MVVQCFARDNNISDNKKNKLLKIVNDFIQRDKVENIIDNQKEMLDEALYLS